MSSHIRAGKPDTNQAEIVEGLRDIGLSVWITSGLGDGFPDLTVGAEMPCPHCKKYFRQNVLVEIKYGKAELTMAEKFWHGGWRGQVGVARTLEEALRLCGRPACSRQVARTLNTVSE